MRYILEFFVFAYRLVATRVRPFYSQLFYFVFISFMGSVLLVSLEPSNPDYTPRYIDMLFLSTSALTVSGLATVQMEDLSSSHIVVLTLWMFLGSEIFVSFLGLMLRAPTVQTKPVSAAGGNNNRVRSVNSVELEAVEQAASTEIMSTDEADELALSIRSLSCEDVLKGDRNARYLGFVVLGYLAITHVLGFLMVFLYISRLPSARAPLARKGINVALFSVSVVVSSCANGGLVPTNENMAVFVKQAPLLLMFSGQILTGNLLFPLCLRLLVWVLWRVTGLRSLERMVTDPEELGFPHLRRKLPTAYLSASVVALLAAGVAMFCAMDWGSSLFDGLSTFQKVVNAFFTLVNARHSGENSIDAGLISPAVLVLIVVMMYLPPSAMFAPPTADGDEVEEDDKKEAPPQKWGSLLENASFSQLGCVAVFVIVICITERRRLRNDPLNFSMLKIIFEVVSAYGNVGMSTGYSCSRLQDLHPGAVCNDMPYSFVGWWSDEGKLALTFVMLYGRLKAFTTGTGKYWKVA
uniref:High-affinity potassium transporter n=1 Tax=Sporobolus virginicus TaxID=751712 RepID=A0A286T5L2_9POAL|nr:high-affinity potassium transporter [Sporobolus virginicus]